jgi:hypothetical protein
MKEIWKKIPDFSRYEASNLGRLRSLDYKRTGKVKVLKPACSNDGYMKTMLLRDDGRYRSWTVHLFIMLTFVGNKPNGMEVNHKNGIKTDNRIENLEYTTRSKNMLHAFRYGLESPKRGEDNPTAKLSSKDVLEIREYVGNARRKGIRYYGRKKLAEKYGICESHIKDIVSGRRGLWSHI